MGTMDFVDDETQVGTHDQLKDTNWSDFNQSGAHLEPFELIDDGGTVAGGVTYATDNSGESGTDGNWFPAYITAFGVRFDSYEGLGQNGHPIVGYHIAFGKDDGSGAKRDLFFPAADQDLSFLTMSSKKTHADSLNADGLGNNDNDNISDQTYVAYADMYAGDPGAQGSDKIVSGTSGDDTFDATYTGDTDGDIVDNDDGNPNEETGNNDSIEAGDGDDRINGGEGNDTMLGQGGDDVFVLNGSDPGNDSIVGGETSETDGDCIDMSGLSEGVKVDMSAGSGESGTITIGGIASAVTPTSNGGTYFASNDLFGGPAFDYGIGKMYVDSKVNTDAMINHVQAGGTDFIVHTGASGTEFWSMDPDTGELTVEHEFVRSFSFHAGATPANTEFVEVGGTLYAYAENREFMDVFKFDASTGNWTAEEEYRWSDVSPTGLNGGNVGPADVHKFADGKTYACVISQYNGNGRLNAYEIDETTGLPDFSTREEWTKTGVGKATNMHLVDTNDGTFLGTCTEVSLGSTGGYYDASAASVNEPFVDANGYLIFAGGHDTGNPQSEPEGGTVTIYNPATNTVFSQISNTNMNGRTIYSVDADGYIYVTMNSFSGGGSTTHPFTIVLDPNNNYGVVSSGHDTNGGFIGIIGPSPGVYSGPTSSVHVTTTTGENFLVQGHGGTTDAKNGYITASSSKIGRCKHKLHWR